MTEQEQIIRFRGVDGTELAARDWNVAGPDADVVLCLHGLTRNSRDFTGVAAWLSGRCRLIAPDQRGRGLSAYADPSTYVLPIQIQDVLALMDQMDIGRCVILGTSMGALMAASMAALVPDRLAGVILNDAGPVIDPAGIARIAGYVGQADAPASWSAAVTRLRTVHGAAFPTYAEADWERFARQTYVWDGSGLRPDYDPRLREAVLASAGVTVDLWPVFSALGQIPGLLLRGDRSDILSQETAETVAERFGTRLAVVRDRGHAPDLSEPDAMAAILGFLDSPAVRERLSSDPVQTGARSPAA